MSWAHIGFIVLFFLLLLLGITWAIFAKHIADRIWPISIRVLNRFSGLLGIDEASLDFAIKDTKQKIAMIWLWRIGGFLVAIFSILGLYYLFKFSW